MFTYLSMSSVGDKAVNAEVQATFVMKKNLRMRKSKIHTEKERERWAQRNDIFQ